MGYLLFYIWANVLIETKKGGYFEFRGFDFFLKTN